MPHSDSLPRSRAARWCSRLLEHRFGAVVLFYGVFVGLSWLMRTALMLEAAEQVTWNSSLLAAAAWGTLFDVAAASLWALPLIVALIVLPRRFFERRSGRVLTHVAAMALTSLIVFGCAAEWFFWDEFGVRFNFIAVDYLVYTTEVIGNIRESYPMPLVFGGIIAGAALVHAALWRTGAMRRWLDHANQPWRARRRAGGLWLAFALIIGLAPNEEWLPDFHNNYNRELGKNGPWSFFAAFRANQLDFDQFYATMPVDAAFRRVKNLVGQDGAQPLGADAHDLTRLVSHPGPEQHLNVIQITVESLSAKYLTRYGGTDDITPHLDALMPHCLVFDNFYATGNRTDRGMEALTLSVPPTPGRSLVKRPHNENLFTLGSLFRQRDYATAFIYGGYGYFDNMNHFFGHNGYRVVDRTVWEPEEITFANVWGACDEDAFNRTLREADTDTAAGKPFFYFVMTTSNHRPYTYPEDCKNYHIPLLIYAPGGQVKPGVVATLCSQIDYAPTLLGLLDWTYPSRFYGRDILAMPPGAPGRAFVANYQKLGLYTPGRLTILKPVRETESFAYDQDTDELTVVSADASILDDAIAYYQSASHLFKHGGQGAPASETNAALIESDRRRSPIVAGNDAIR